MAEQVTTAEMGGQTQAPRGRAMAERARAQATTMWRTASGAMRKPAIGAGVAGAAVLAAGAFWGVTEAALAGVAAYAVYRALSKRGERPAPAREAT